MLQFTDNALHVPFRRRANQSSAAELGRPGNPDAGAQSSQALGDPQRRVTLSSDRLHEEDILRGMTSDRQEHRNAALNAIRDTAQVLGDLVTGNQTVRLSEGGLFPPEDRGGIPTAVSIGDQEREQVDTRWTGLFEGFDGRQQTDNLLFRIEDVYHAVRFERYERGEKIEMSQVEGGDEVFEAYYYAAGMQFNASWADFNPHSWNREDSVSAMMTRFAKKQMKRAYNVLTDSQGLSTISYQSGSTQTEQDVKTINEGMRSILDDLFTEPSPKSDEQVEEVPDNPQFALLFNNLAQGYNQRVRKALATTFSASNDELSIAELDYPVTPIGTPHVPAGNWWVVMPGRKNVAAQFRDLQTFDVMDPRIVGVNEGQVGQGIFRMVRGDSNQVAELATS